MNSGGIRGWMPNRRSRWFLAAWFGATALFVLVIVPKWADATRQDECSSSVSPKSMTDPALIGEPTPSARLAPKLTPARGTAEDSVFWPTAAGSPNGLFAAGSSPLLREGGGRAIPSSAVTAWLQVDNGTAVLSVCVDSFKSGPLDHGTFAGFAFVPTSDPAKSLTVRHELSVQSTYAGSFWTVGIIMVVLGVALTGDKLARASKPVKWIAALTGIGAFSGAYYANALSNPTWGGLEAIGTLMVTSFTATIGAIAAAAAAKDDSASRVQADS